jgi:uncharacterized protein YbjT (DUF2867 family)
MNQKILVVGATGMLGEPVARELARQGYAVRVLARNPQKAGEKLGPGFEIVSGDVEKPETLPAALAGCDGVHINLAGGPTAESYQRIETQGTAHVVKAAAQAGVQHITYLSGASVDIHRTQSIYCKAKLDAEKAIQAGGVAYTVFRASWFFESLPLFIQGNQAIVIGKQPNPVHWLAAGDYARMVVKAYQTPAAARQIFPIYGPEALPMMDALKYYCATVHPGMKASTMPIWLARLMGKLTGNLSLSDIADFLAYYETIFEQSDPTPANQVLGAPTMTLAEWCTHISN